MPFIFEEFFVLYFIPLILLCICIIFAHYVNLQHRTPPSSSRPPSEPSKPFFYAFLGYSPEFLTSSLPPNVHTAPNQPPPLPPDPAGRSGPHPPDASLRATLVGDTEERWLRLQEKAKLRTQDLESAINSLSDFETAHNRLKTWLGEKERMASVLGPIGVEPGILRNQKLQVEVMAFFFFLILIFVKSYY